MMPSSENRENTFIPTPPEAFSTWHDLAGHRLRSPAADTQGAEAIARRLAALQRWRGLGPKVG